jgi:hypothetical protein
VQTLDLRRDAIVRNFHDISNLQAPALSRPDRTESEIQLDDKPRSIARVAEPEMRKARLDGALPSDASEGETRKSPSVIIRLHSGGRQFWSKI